MKRLDGDDELNAVSWFIVLGIGCAAALLVVLTIIAAVNLAYWGLG